MTQQLFISKKFWVQNLVSAINSNFFFDTLQEEIYAKWYLACTIFTLNSILLKLRKLFPMKKNQNMWSNLLLWKFIYRLLRCTCQISWTSPTSWETWWRTKIPGPGKKMISKIYNIYIHFHCVIFIKVTCTEL